MSKQVRFSTDNQFVNIDGVTYQFKELGKNENNEVAFIYKKVEENYGLPKNKHFISIKKLDWSDIVWVKNKKRTH